MLEADPQDSAIRDKYPLRAHADPAAEQRASMMERFTHPSRQPRRPDDWGALRAWSWGAAGTLDYLHTRAAIDSQHIGIEGVSRWGKGALVTLAFEPNFAMGLIGSSGKGGAILLRRNFGEAVASLTGGEYDWMVGNFERYVASEDTGGTVRIHKLPVDSDELIALRAPRLTFISYGDPAHGNPNELDQRGSSMATVAAQPVFQLLGAKGLGIPDDPHATPCPPSTTVCSPASSPDARTTADTPTLPTRPPSSSGPMAG